MRNYFYLIIAVTFLASGCAKDKFKPFESPLKKAQTTPWPEWIFRHWVWEDESTQQSAQQIVDDYLSRDIPVGAIIIDSPWETGYNTFSWDKSLYPNPKAMVDYFHSRDVRVFLWITGVINTDAQPMYDEAAAKGYFITKSASDTTPLVQKWWKGPGSPIDWYNPAAVEWWKKRVDSILAIGIDGWKVDGTDFVVTGGYSRGLGAAPSRVDYSRKYYDFFHTYTREKLGIDRVNTTRPIDTYYGILGVSPANAVNFSFSDVSNCWAGWVGDQDPDYKGLRVALDNMYLSAQFGYLSFGSDIGGYRENTTDYGPRGRTEDLFLRWAQFGAFCSIMENGGGGEHRPWMFSNNTTDIYRKFTKLHHAMIPYLQSSADSLWKQKKSMYHFMDRTTYAYLLGSDVFVTPIMKIPANNIAINFPAGGRWVYLFDNTKVFDGGTSTTMSFDYEEFPVFVREGAKVLDMFKPLL